jgi:hypothetical protein
VAFPQFGATIIYHHDVYSWQASTSAENAETCPVLSTIAGHPATPAGREPWPPCRHVMHLERFLKTADEVGVIPQLDELDGSHISKSAIWGYHIRSQGLLWIFPEFGVHSNSVWLAVSHIMDIVL